MVHIHRVNEHRVWVPDSMSVNHGGRGPGAYDCIVYRGVEIFTYEQDRPTRIYTGRFAVGFEDADIMDVATLKEARELIDAYRNAPAPRRRRRA